MPTAVWTGIALTLVAGISSGTSMLPMKFARRWRWENLWLVFSVLSLLVLPWWLGIELGGDLWGVYSSLTAGQLLPPLILGAGWGIAQVLFGLSIARLGLALAYAVIIGLGSLGGTLLPLVFKHREVLGTANGALILAGLVVMLAGIAVSAYAGQRRESSQPKAAGSGYAAALLLAIVCGLLAPMINYSFAFGQDIAVRAMQLGVSPVHAAYTVWPVTLTGGLIPNLSYAIYLLCRNKSWGNFRGPWLADMGIASSMSVLWMGSIAVYGVAAVYLGTLGTSVGYGLFQIFMIITANVSGLVTGEWREAPTPARRVLYAGLGLLAVATALLAGGNR